MATVMLITDDGRPVVEARIPPFRTAPDIVMWGQRLFMRDGMTVGGASPTGPMTYREGFCVATVDARAPGAHAQNEEQAAYRAPDRDPA